MTLLIEKFINNSCDTEPVFQCPVELTHGHTNACLVILEVWSRMRTQVFREQIQLIQ